MRNSENSGFSLDASVRIPSWDRQGLERLLRFCARPCFAGENLRRNGPWLIYRLPKRISAIDKETTNKIEKVSFNWCQLIARIYEVDPLICRCGKEMKIIKFVTHPAEISRILLGLGWPTEIPEFDPPMDLFCYDVCQLISGTKDEFSESSDKNGQDPPYLESYCDPPHWDDHSDPPHWED